MDKKTEFTKRITYIAKRLGVDADDLKDWYASDVDDVTEMAGSELIKIVREYFSLKDVYRAAG